MENLEKNWKENSMVCTHAWAIEREWPKVESWKKKENLGRVRGTAREFFELNQSLNRMEKLGNYYIYFHVDQMLESENNWVSKDQKISDWKMNSGIEPNFQFLVH